MTIENSLVDFPNGSPDTGNTAYMILNSALVMIMTPGVALFYGGLTRKKNVVSIFAHSLVALMVVTVQWSVMGYGLAFGSGDGYIGDEQFFLLRHVNGKRAHINSATIPHNVYMVYQMMFAIVTASLMTGAWAERMPLQTWTVFVWLWTTIVYDPIAHWTWAPNGWMFNLPVLDFAGGTVVHICSGTSAVVAAILVGPRVNFDKRKEKDADKRAAYFDRRPHNIPLVLVGTALIYFGWFGFNAGSALVSNGQAGSAFVATQIAAATGGLGWGLGEIVWERKKPSLVGICSGIVAGLVSITPAAGFVNPMPALLFGFAGGLVAYSLAKLTKLLPIDDALDAGALHGGGGICGALLTGIFAQRGIPAESGIAIDGGWLSGHFEQIGYQFAGIGAVLGYSAVLTALLLLFFDLPYVKKVFGLRVSDDHQMIGLDKAEHGEEAYVTDVVTA